MANYKLNKLAKQDLKEIYHYGYLNFGEAQADIYYLAMFDRFKQIAENPYLYPQVDYIRKGYRRSVFQKHSIYYRITDNGVEIISIIGAQDLGKKFT